MTGTVAAAAAVIETVAVAVHVNGNDTVVVIRPVNGRDASQPAG
jgi:hypothetical protein